MFIYHQNVELNDSKMHTGIHKQSIIMILSCCSRRVHKHSTHDIAKAKGAPRGFRSVRCLSFLTITFFSNAATYIKNVRVYRVAVHARSDAAPIKVKRAYSANGLKGFAQHYFALAASQPVYLASIMHTRT